MTEYHEAVPTELSEPAGISHEDRVIASGQFIEALHAIGADASVIAIAEANRPADQPDTDAQV